MYIKNLSSKNLAIILLIIIFVFLLPLVLMPSLNILDQYDESDYHYKIVLKFINEFPEFDLVNDYIIPMTPLYHITISTFGYFITENLFFLRTINLILSLLCLLSLFFLLSKRSNEKKIFFFLLLFFFSPYFIGPSIRLSTDNYALLFIFLSVISISQINSESGIGRGIKSNLFILLTILVRQVHSWLIGVYTLLTLIAGFKEKKSLKKIIISLLPLIIPVSAMIFFFLMWNGLMAPLAHHARYAKSAINIEAFIYIISLFALYNSFFFLWIYKLGERQIHSVKIYSIIAFTALLVLVFFPISNEYHESLEGLRGGSLWLAISKLPMIFDNSIVIWILFPIGLIYMYLFLRYFIINKSYLELTILLCWLLANIFNPATYQKYYEPFILFFIGFVFITLKVEKKLYWLGPAALLIIFIIVDLFRFFYPLF